MLGYWWCRVIGVMLSGLWYGFGLCLMGMVWWCGWVILWLRVKMVCFDLLVGMMR